MSNDRPSNGGNANSVSSIGLSAQTWFIYTRSLFNHLQQSAPFPLFVYIPSDCQQEEEEQQFNWSPWITPQMMMTHQHFHPPKSISISNFVFINIFTSELSWFHITLRRPIIECLWCRWTNGQFYYGSVYVRNRITSCCDCGILIFFMPTSGRNSNWITGNNWWIWLGFSRDSSQSSFIISTG